jgi:hypothetical protein
MGWMAEELVFDSQLGQEILLFFPTNIQTGSGEDQLPTQYTLWALSPGA